MKVRIKQIISIVLVVAMTITNNGLMVFADSVESIVNNSSSEEKVVPNYYYDAMNESYEEETTISVEEYQAYLESENPGVFGDEPEEDEESNEDTGENYENSVEEEPEEDETETEEETEKETETETETESEESSESLGEEEIATTSDATEEEIEEIIEEETLIKNNKIATTSQAQEETEETEEETLAEDETIATESEVDEIIATESEAEEEVATESEVNTKEKIIATVSKVSWKVKKVLIATYASINVKMKETEEDRKARLATYANVIIVNDKGEEKMFKVALNWKMIKRYDVNAKSTKQETPISTEVWREALKVDEFIKDQSDVIASTSNIALLENRIKEENAKLEDKEYVLKIYDKNDVNKATAAETKEKTTEKVETKTEVETAETETTEVEQTEVETSIEEQTETETSGEETEATVEGFGNTDEIDETTKEETQEVVEETAATQSEVEDTFATVSEMDVAGVESINTNGEEIIGDSINYYDLQTIYLYKVDVASLAEEIIELINEENSKSEEEEEEVEVVDEEPAGLFKSFKKLFGFNFGSSADDEEVEEKTEKATKVEDEEESLEDYLEKAQVDVLEDVELESIVAEFDALLLGAGAQHTQHQVSAQIKGKVITEDNMFDSVIGGEESDMLDISQKNKKVKATGSNIFIAGTYYLPGDITISNQWLVEENNTLTLCLNGHNVKFATAGCVRGYGRVVVCNCEGTSRITTAGPHIGWKDRWYASTSETYIKWNEHSLFAGNEVGIYANNNNIIFENIVIKNQYNGRKAVAQMEDQEMDEAEYSGDGSILWGKQELQVYGVKFENNRATRSNGVAANAQLGKLLLENCTFNKNINQTNRGGAVAFNPKATQIYNCTFTNNISFTNGGALYGRSYINSTEKVEIGTKITKSTFEGNIAQFDGGAIFMDYLCAKGVTIDGTESDKIVFKNNIAGASGGAIAVHHVRAVDGEHNYAYSYEDGTARERLLNINYATFEKNVAKGITINKTTGEASEDDDRTRENYGGAIYVNSQTNVYDKFTTDAPIKEMNIKNCEFTENFTKGIPLEIKAQDESGNFVGEVLAKYNVGNAGGAVYINKVPKVTITDTKLTKNESMTGANLCVKESTVSFIGGELSKGKAYNSLYSATEFYKRVVSPGGGAAYIMEKGHIAISNNTKVDSNENAFYLDGGSIDMGSSEVKSNTGEYLIGYTNYKSNTILFSGVNIKNHEFHETHKDYTATKSFLVDGRRDYSNGNYAPSYILFKEKNEIAKNKRKFYTKNGSSYTVKEETANIVINSIESNIKIDLSKYLFDVPFTDQDVSARIGLYYEFDPEGPDEIIAYDKWDYREVKVIDEGGIWTNYFEVDNSHKNEWAEDWKFYIDKNYIRMSPHIVEVRFDSYIGNVPRIKPQHYNVRTEEGKKAKIATPTEIVRRDIKTPGKTLLGFMGVDKTDDSNTKYGMWDFDKCVIDPHNIENGEIVIILLYTDNTIQVKSCGCTNGTTCKHDEGNINHADRGTGVTRDEIERLNYIEVATYPQLAYRYQGKKTQYVLSKDLTLTAAQSREFIEGGIVLNLNGYKLTYDTSESNDAYIFSTLENDEMLEDTDAKIMISGVSNVTTETKGTIEAIGTHKGAFILADSDVYLNQVDIKNISAVGNSDKAFIHSDLSNINTQIYTNDVTFENVDLKSDLINAGSRVLFENAQIKNSSFEGSVVKLKAGSYVDTEVKLLNSEISGISYATSLVSSSIMEPIKGTKVIIASSSILNSTFESHMVSLKREFDGDGATLNLKGNVAIKGNTVKTGSALLYSDAVNSEDCFGETAEDVIEISDNKVPDYNNVSVVALYQKTITFKGRIICNNNVTTTGKATNKVSAVRSGKNTRIKFDDVAVRIYDNQTKYEWHIENDSDDPESYNEAIFHQNEGTKLNIDDTVIKLSLSFNSEVKPQKIYDNWDHASENDEKEAEATFMRDDSYEEDSQQDIYKQGLSKTKSNILMGANHLSVIFRIHKYKEGVDERKDASVEYIDAVTQRVEPNIYTLLDTPQYSFDLSQTSIMWEGFAYRQDDGSYDYSKERLYPEHTETMAVQTERSILITGYIYNHNNKRHVHEGNKELWTEARNEGHLQATNSFVFLHNDVEITRKLEFTPETTYHLCLNGHKLIFNYDGNWFDSDTCNLIICDCKKTGSIVQNKGQITNDIIKVQGGSFDISDVEIGPFTDVVGGSFAVIDENIDTSFKNIKITEVNVDYTNNTNKAFIDIPTYDTATVSNVTFKQNKLKSNSESNSILSINNKTLSGTKVMKGIVLDGNEVSHTGGNGAGYIFRYNGYEKVTFESIVVKSNSSEYSAPIEVTGNDSLTSTLNFKNVTFTDNQKVYNGTTYLSEQWEKGISANFAAAKFNILNIDGGLFKGNKFIANNQNVGDDEGAVIDFVNYASTLAVRNVTFDGTGTSAAKGLHGIVVLDRSDDLFENVTFTNYNIGNSNYLTIAKGTVNSPAGSYIGRTTFRGNTKFTNNKARSMLYVESNREDANNEYEGLVLLNGIEFVDNTDVNTGYVSGTIGMKSNVVMIASGTNIIRNSGTALFVDGTAEVKLLNAEISAGTGTKPAVHIKKQATLTIGDKVVVKGNAINIYLEGDQVNNAKVKALDGHIIKKNSDISFTFDDADFNFFDEWGKNYIENYDYHEGKTYAYLPTDLFKLDTGMNKNRRIYLDGNIDSGKQKLWISSSTTNYQYATVVFMDEEIAGPKEILRQYVKAETTTKLARVQIDYLSTISQIWMTESDGTQVEILDAWIVYSNGKYTDFEVKNYEAGKTYYAYLTKKHLHKICGPDALETCGPNHADGIAHTTDLEFMQVGTNENIIKVAELTNNLGLENNLTISQEALNTLTDRDIVFCLNGFVLTFAKGATLTTQHSFTFVDCVGTGHITVEKGATLDKALIDVSGSNNTFSLYNISFDTIDTNAPIVKVANVKVVNEAVTFTNINTTAANGTYDIQSGSLYIKEMSYTKNVASASTLLNLDFGRFTVGKLEDIIIKNNKYTNKLLTLSGTGTADAIKVENNTILAGGGEDAYGAIYISNGANITYTKDVQMLSNSAAANEKSKGGAFAVYGTLNLNANVTLEKNKAGIGGAVFVNNSGFLNVSGEAYFKNNEAKYGGAIYCENWSRISMNRAVYDNNIASVHGVVAFGGEYNSKAVFKNHTKQTKELIYNLNDDGTDSITLDKDTIFVDNLLIDSLIYLRNVSNSSVGVSYLSNGNTAKNFIELDTGSLIVDDAKVTDNTFTDSVFSISNPRDVKIASLSVYDNKFGYGISVKGGVVNIGNSISFKDNLSRSGKMKEFRVSGEGGYFKAYEKLSMGKKYLISSYKAGIKVFEKWNATYIENYDNPQSKNPGKYMVTPEASDIIKISGDDADKGYGLYKVGATNSQDIYIGKEGEDFVQIRFIDPEDDNIVFATQNLEKGKETKLDKVDTLECEIEKQRWVATMSDGSIRTFIFTTVQTASLSEHVYIPYTRPHLHKMCGLRFSKDCEHMDGAVHIEEEYRAIGNASELNTTTYEYVYITNNLVVNDTMALSSGLKGICLNGFSITFEGDGTKSFIDINRDIAICNCRNNGGIIRSTSENITKPLINFEGSNLGLYNISFKEINLSDSFVKLSVSAKLVAERLTFDNNTKIGPNGIIDGANTNEVYLDNIVISNSKQANGNVLLSIYDNYKLNNLTFENNETNTTLVTFNNTNNKIIMTGLNFINNKVANNSMIMSVEDSAKIEVANDVIFEKNTNDNSTLVLNDNSELVVRGTMSFIQNTAKKYAGIKMVSGSDISVENMILDNNITTDENCALIYFADSTLSLDNVLFKNHQNENGVLIANEDTNDTSKVYLSGLTFTNNKGIAISLDGIVEGRIEGLTLDSTLQNNFKNVLVAKDSSLKISDFVVENNNLQESVMLLEGSDIEINNIRIKNNTITSNTAAALEVVDSNSVVKVKGLIQVDDNTKNIKMGEGSYLKAIDMIKKESKMDFVITGSSQKIFESWDASHIEGFGIIASKSNPRKYAFTPENSGLFSLKAQGDYAIYKGGVNNDVGIYAGNRDSYSVLSFVYIDEDHKESIIDTQNVIKGTEPISTVIDTVDTYEYELEYQTWYAPNAETGAQNVKWEFINKVISNINTDANIRYVRKHRHKICGTKYSEECNHASVSNAHTESLNFVDATSSDAAYWPNTAEYINISNDIVFTSNIDLGNIKGICLNGHKIIIDNVYTTFLYLSSELTICDCRHKVTENGGITTLEGKTISNSLIRVDAGGILTAYNVRFKDLTLADDVDFKSIYTYVIENSIEGQVRLYKPIFTGSIESGSKGLIGNKGTADKFIMIEPTFIGMTVDSLTPILQLTSKYTISTLSFINNKGCLVSPIEITDDVSISSLIVINNKGQTSQGFVNIKEGYTLTLTESNVFEGNESQGGGVIKVAGTLKAEKDLIFRNNTVVKGTGRGGALYVEENGKVITNGRTEFIGNSAMFGAAIYAENISESAFKDMKEPVFEDNNALTRAVVYWSGDLKLSTPTFINHKLYNKTTSKGVRTALVMNYGEGDGLVLENPLFVNNAIVGGDDSASAINVTGLKQGSRIVGFDDNSRDNVVLHFINADNSNLVIDGSFKEHSNNNIFINTIATLKNSGTVKLNNVVFEAQRVENSALYVEGAPITVRGIIRVAHNAKTNGDATKDIYLADDDAYIVSEGVESSTSLLDDDSIMNIYTGVKTGTKVFEGWNEYNIIRFDKPDKKNSDYRYVYSPETSPILVINDEQKAEGLEFYKKGYYGDGDGNGSVYIGTKENFVTLRYYNDIEEVDFYIAKDGDKEYYCYQNIMKSVPTRLDIVDSQEYELDKQEWFVGYVSNAVYSHKQRFNPAAPTPTIDGVNGVVETFDTDQEIRYHQYHIHKACGYKLSDDCDHEGYGIHSGTVEYESVKNIEELEEVTGYAVLVRDLDMANLQRGLNLQAGLKGICLNGHTLKGDGRFTLLNFDREFILCDCKFNKGTGGITSNESFVQAENLINVNSDEDVQVYGLRIKDISFGQGYAINVEKGNVYIDSLELNGSMRAGAAGVIRSVPELNIDKLSLLNNNMTGTNPLFKLISNINVNELKLSNNKMEDSLVVIDKNVTLKDLVLTENESVGKGALYISASQQVIANKHSISKNSARNGAAMYVEGAFIGQEEDTYIDENIATEKGGVFYIADGARVSLARGTTFAHNKASSGAVMYAENLAQGDATLSNSRFVDNIASASAVIDFGGYIELTDATFESAAGGQGFITNINRENVIDKAVISSISFISNNIKGDAIILSNVQDGTIVKNIKAYNNKLNSLIRFDHILAGYKVYVTNVLEVEENEFAHAGIAFENVREGIINNVKFDNNKSTGYGMTLIEGQSTKVYSVGQMTYTNNVNTDKYGAAITILDRAKLDEDGGLDVYNNRSYGGGAIYLDGEMAVQSQGSIPLNVSSNYIGDTIDTSNIFITNTESYVTATGGLNESSILGFTAGDVNVTAFKYWNSAYIGKIGSTDTISYTPESCGMFIVDTLSKNAKQELYKSGTGENIEIKLGANFTKLHFVTASNDVEYSTQNIERGVETTIDKVIVHSENDKWIAPSTDKNIADYKWSFNRGEVTASYDTENEYIYKYFTYSITYTGGEVGGINTYTNIEYGELVVIEENTFEGREFKNWLLRDAPKGVDREYLPGDIVKSLCNIEDDEAIFDARWKGDITIKINPNGEKYGLNIPYDNSYEIYTKAGEKVALDSTYPYSLGGKGYNSYKYSTDPNGAGNIYKRGEEVSFSDDTILYLIWSKEDNGKQDGSRGSGGSGGGGYNINSNGVYSLVTDSSEIGPGVVDQFVKIGEYTIDKYGSIRDKNKNVVGNTTIGDRVNADGSFTASNGITLYPNGAIQDAAGNRYNPDGTITTYEGNTYFANGDVMDRTGTIYHPDGSVTLTNGVYKDAAGVLHYENGSITLPNGTTYQVDGTILSIAGTQINADTQVMENGIIQAETPGNWSYDPTFDNWKFENRDENGEKTTYVDQWISTKNNQGQTAWYVVDRDGNMMTGWVKSEGEFYYLSKDVKTKGELVKGTVNINGIPYTFDPATGALLDGKVPTRDFGVLGAVNHISGVDGEWKVYETGEKYFVTYLDMPDGRRLEIPPSDWYMIDGSYHFFGKYGIPETGLMTYDGKYYYFDDNGAMKEGGEVTIGDSTYVFDKATGACRTIIKNF